MFAIHASAEARKAPPANVVLPLLAIATIYVAGLRFLAGAEMPLWVDETWSAMIATKPTWTEFWREAWLDCNPPLYYLVLAAWTSIVGDSNFMLRLPSGLFVLAAAAAPLMVRLRDADPAILRTWALLLLAWQPGLFVIADARGYGLILLLSVLSCLALCKLLRKADLSSAIIWVGLNTLMFLTHYYAAVLALGQAAVVVYLHRSRVLRLWPAALAAIPGLAWFFYHYPRLQDYARPDVIWYEPLTIPGAIGLFVYVFGAGQLLTLAVLTIIAVALVRRHFRQEQVSSPEENRSGDLPLIVGSGATAFVIAMLVGATQPSLTPRYLIPLAPPAMLALALALRCLPRPDLMTAAVVLAMILPGFSKPGVVRELSNRAAYGFENGSDFVNAYQPDSVVLLWDHPASKILDRGSLTALGSYLLARSGAKVRADAIVIPDSADGNIALREAATGKRPAIIWLYNTARRSAARDHPPTFASDARWSCHHQGLTQREKSSWWGHTKKQAATMLGAIACVKTGNSL